jgi:excisionase family DNA binding protein
MTTLLTIKQVADWLNMKCSTLYAWAGQGKIPCRKIYGLIRFDPEEVALWVDSFRPQPQSVVFSRKHCKSDVELIIARAKAESLYSAPGDQTSKGTERRLPDGPV